MNQHAPTLPLTQRLRWFYLFSLLIGLLTAAASLMGIFAPNDIYPTQEIAQSFVANDVVNLFIGLPILLLSMWLAWRGRLLGLLFWPGALFYGLYNYTAYLFGVSFSGLFALYLVIVTLSVYTIIGLVAAIEGTAVKGQLDGRVPVRFGGGVLAVMGFAFSVRTLFILVNQTAASTVDQAVASADFILGVASIIGGIMLWRRRPLGFVGGTGLLFYSSMLFVGVIAFLLLQPVLHDTPLPVDDIIVLLVMGLVTFLPFGFFVRGVIQAQNASGQS